MREDIAHPHVFLGDIPNEHRDRLKDSPLVRPWDGDLAAVWDYGPGGAPHGAAWGTTGGGKSSLGRSVGRGLVRKPGRRAITFIDAEGAGEYNVFKRMPGVLRPDGTTGIINVNPAADAKLEKGQPTSVDQAVEILAAHLALAVERNEERMQAQDAWEAHLFDPVRNRPPTYVPPAEVWLFIDGWASLRHNVNRYHRRGKVDVIEDMILYGRTGRKVDCHLFILDQVSYASRSKQDTGMPSELKKQIGCRIIAAGRLGATKTESDMGLDDPDAWRLIPKQAGGCVMRIGAELLPFVVPKWDLATDPTVSLSIKERRDAYRLLPVPLEVA